MGEEKSPGFNLGYVRFSVFYSFLWFRAGGVVSFREKVYFPVRSKFLIHLTLLLSSFYFSKYRIFRQSLLHR